MYRQYDGDNTGTLIQALYAGLKQWKICAQVG